MKLLQRQLFRQGMVFVLFFLLVVCSAFLSLGMGVFRSAQDRLFKIDSGYQTIAVSKGWDADAVRALKSKPYDTLPDGSLKSINGTVLYSDKALFTAAEKAPQVKAVYRGGLLSANLKNGKTVTPPHTDRVAQSQTFGLHTNRFSVLALECLSIEDNPFANQGGSPITLSVSFPLWKGTFRIVSAPSVISNIADEIPLEGQTVTMADRMMAPDGEYPFEVGKTYLVRGFLTYSTQNALVNDPLTNVPQLTEVYRFSLSMTTTYIEIGEQIGSFPVIPGLIEQPIFGPGLRNFGITTSEPVPNDDGMTYNYYYYAPQDHNPLPFYAEYQGNLENFLASEEGAVWRNEIIPWTQTSQNTVSVVLTDSIESLYSFNEGVASIRDGRSFFPGEYESGSDVCVISASLAEKNGWNVGDMVSLDLYDPGYMQHNHSVSTGVINEYLRGFSYIAYPISEENRLNLEKEYRIVGIYTAPEWAISEQNFSADTIFVPKNSVSNAENYEDPEVSYLNSIVIENGSDYEFEVYMREQGMAGYFLYFDQDFSAVNASYRAIARTANGLFLLSSVVFLLVLALFCLLCGVKLSPIVRSMRLLGVSKQRTFRSILLCFVPLSLVTLLAGNAVAFAAFRTVSEKILTVSLDVDSTVFVVSAAVQLFIIVAATVVLSAVLVNKNLMNARK